MKRFLSILLCLCLMAGILTGCAEEDPQAYIPTGDALVYEDVPEDTKVDRDQEQEMALAYYADRSMNPLSSSDYTNRVVLSLIYQGLFAVNRDYEVIPILCKSYTVTADMMTYEFTVDPEATFSDGMPVQAEDVAASLRRARKTSYYSGRLRHIQSINATENGTVIVKLKYAYENFPLLLDIPIVKADEVEADMPLGTGPYVLSGGEVNRSLVRRSNWWCESDDLLITAHQIPLLNAEDITQVRDYFEFSNVGVVCTDPGSDRYVEYRCDYELWDCETGLFVYLGINKSSSDMKNKAVRQAVSKGIDRTYLVDTYYRGFAVPAELPASPNSPYYTPALAQQYAYDQMAFMEGMTQGNAQSKSIVLLVNSDDSLRLRVAQEIGRMLNTCGMIVEVVGKDTDAYKLALEEGEYDLYLGQTKLAPNMDLTPFFSESGALNFGQMDNLSVYTQCLQALENQGNYYTLHQTVMDEGYLCPVLFRSYAVYANRGLLTDLEPARDNLFCYSIGKSLTEAYTVKE